MDRVLLIQLSYVYILIGSKNDQLRKVSISFLVFVHARLDEFLIAVWYLDHAVDRLMLH